MKNLALIVKRETAGAMHSLNTEGSNPARGVGEPRRNQTEDPRRESLSENYIGELDAWFLGA